MATEPPSLMRVYEGWDGHQLALVRAITPLSPEQLSYRPTPQLRSAGEIIGHIAFGRLDWFHRMGAPGSAALARQIAPWEGERADTEHPAELSKWLRAAHDQQTSIAEDPAELVRWLEASWRMIETTLTTWTVADLEQTYRHAYQGTMYAVSRQWTIWRIMSHDLHHGGELAILLGLQGISIPDLGDQGGHLTELTPAGPPDPA
jgi:uncharacterized damage-inducible protein DinB